MSLDQLDLLQIALRVVAAIVVFIIGRWLASRARTALRTTLSKTAVAPSMTRLLLLLVYYGILLITLISSLALIGFPITALLTASLIFVVILGIALQQSIANLAATIVFMLFQPFKLGELIKANNVLGTVKEIQFFSTVLVTGDNLEVTIPNAKIQGDTLWNYTRLGMLRIDFVFNVSYHTDIEQVKRVLLELLTSDPRVLTDPAPFIFVQTLGDDGMQIAARPWVKPGTPGLEHRIGGIEKEDVTGNISYAPANHELMTRVRARKVAAVAADIPPTAIRGDEAGDLLVVGWGSTYGSIAAAVDEVRARGKKVSQVHLRHLNPLPPNLSGVLRRFKHVLVPEMNMGQLLTILRATYLVDAVGLNKIQGQPFKVSEVAGKIMTMLEE